MDLWQQFGVVALAHFLALISPGPDFLLILRASLTGGLRRAWPVCVGIALANAAYIGVALSGVTLLRQSTLLFGVWRGVGCAYLAWLGWRFLLGRGQAALDGAGTHAKGEYSCWREGLRGFLSGILNPKNALFYASLFALVMASDTPAWVQTAYGIWMFAVVLGWDLLVAAVVGRPAVVQQFARHVGKVERGTGALLLTLAAAMLVAAH